MSTFLKKCYLKMKNEWNWKDGGGLYAFCVKMKTKFPVL